MSLFFRHNKVSDDSFLFLSNCLIILFSSLFVFHKCTIMPGSRRRSAVIKFSIFQGFISTNACSNPIQTQVQKLTLHSHFSSQISFKFLFLCRMACFRGCKSSANLPRNIDSLLERYRSTEVLPPMVARQQHLHAQRPLIIKCCTVPEVDFFALHLPLTNWILCH